MTDPCFAGSENPPARAHQEAGHTGGNRRVTRSVASPVFIDTNVLVYWHDASHVGKQACARDWIEHLVRRRLARTSFQVLFELYSVLSRKLTDFTATECRDIVRVLSAWQPVAPNRRTLERSWLLQERYSLSWWDALIVAAANASDCRVLLTEDLQHDQVLDDIRVINPFRSPERTPAEVLDALSR